MFSAPKPRHWIELAVLLQKERANTCILGDQGALFHDVAFRQGPRLMDSGQVIATAILFGIFRRYESMEANKAVLDMMVGGADRFLDRLRQTSKRDVEILNDSLWGCIAVGCTFCPTIEISGLCFQNLTEQIRAELLDSFAIMLRLDLNRVVRWFHLLGFSSPPPWGWGMRPADYNVWVEKHQSEITPIIMG